MPDTPIHQEIELPSPLRWGAMLASISATAAVIVSAQVLLMGLTLSRVPSMPGVPGVPSGRSLMPNFYWWYLLLLGMPLIGLVRIAINHRNTSTAITNAIQRRDATHNAPRRRVFWRRHPPGKVKANVVNNPIWTPSPVATASDEIAPFVLHPPGSELSGASLKRVVMLTVIAGALPLAAFNLVPGVPVWFGAIPAVFIFLAAYLQECPAPLRRDEVRITHDGITIDAPGKLLADHQWDEHDLLIMGQHKGRALCMVRHRASGKRTRFVLRAENIAPLAVAAAGDTEAQSPEAPLVAVASSTVTTSIGVPLPRSEHSAPSLPPSATLLVVGALIASSPLYLVSLVIADRVFTPARSPHNPFGLATPTISPTLVAGIVAGSALLIATIAIIAVTRRGSRRFLSQLQAIAFEPGHVTIPSDATPNSADLPRRIEPSYEETVFTHRDPLWHYIAPSASFIVVVGGLRLTGAIDAALTWMLLAALAIGAIVGVLAGGMDRRTLMGLHPRADAQGLELPRFRAEPAVYLWSRSTLIVLSDKGAVARCRVLDTSDGRTEQFSVASRDLPLLLGSVSAAHATSESCAAGT